MIKNWAFEFFPNPHGHGGDGTINREEEKAFWDFYMDLWCSAEDLNFHGLLLSEHHFGGGYSPAPNLLIPPIANKTKNLRLGVMGNVVPYHAPWRLLEEYAMLDNMTDGRLEIGLSAGIPAELAKVGLEPGEARARFNEAAEVIDKGLASPVISHDGEFWKFEDMPIVPPFVQDPPPKWTTVISEESARNSARRGAKISTGFISTEKVKGVFDAYNEEAAKAGNPTGPDMLGLRRQVIIDLDESINEKAAGFAEGFKEMVANFDKRVIAPGKKALDADGQHGYAFGDDEFVSGTPEQVAAQIVDQCTRSGAGHFMAVFAGHQSLDELKKMWHLFGTQVIPMVNAAMEKQAELKSA